MNDWILPLLVGIPALGALAVALAPAKRDGLFSLALLFCAAEAALAIFTFTKFDGTNPNEQFSFSRPWFALPTGAGEAVPVAFHLGIDGLSLLLVALSGLLAPVILLSAKGHIERREREFLVWSLVMIAGMQGVFLSRDLLLFYFFWEISLIPLYFIIGIWGGPRRVYATVKFFLYTLAGSVVMLIALLYLAYNFGTVAIQELSTKDIPVRAQLGCFLAFALAFAIKVPMVPFHTWLPDAHVEAPTAGSIVLAGVLLKMGTYGFLRLGVGMFPAAAVQCGPWIAGIGAAGIIYGSLLAYGQSDMKKLIACSSVAHMGTIVVGMFALNAAGLRGGILQMINHGLSTGLLFLLVGVLYERRHVREIAEFGGLAQVIPAFAVVLTVATFSSIGLPGLNGFPGEFLCLKGAFDASPLLGAAAAVGTVLGAVYMLSMLRRVAFGPITRGENQKLIDLNGREWASAIILLIPMVWIGLQPSLFIKPTEPAVDLLISQIEKGRRSLALENGASLKIANAGAAETGKSGGRR
ncbi:MAG: NADH-quinone oxidoreductase subunit M [Planctomycetes bacterium]|nr:NADH-quinone oxidoreductase subunit M [Planctomycetota bacterium]